MRCVPITVPYERGEAQTAALHDLCRALFPNPSATKLESVEMHDHVNRIQVQILSGGLTNTLLRVEYANTDDENSTVSVVVRVFGPDSERIVDRRMERFFQPLFLHTFGFGVNCLVYEYLSGYRPLESSELSSDAKLQATIAKSLAHFHWKTTTASLLCAAIHNEPPDSDTVLTSWYESCASPVVRQRLAEQKLSSHLDLLLQGLSSCRGRLMHTLDMVRAEMPVVICHNDLLAGNIMRRANSSDSCGSDVLDAGSCSARRSEELCLIDFEYTRRNYLYFDFANHFNEYAGFECDWSRFPNQAVQLRFVRDYYTAHFELFAMAAHSSNPTTPAAHHGSTPQHVAAYHYSEERTYALIQFCTLISHVKWILWALLQQAYSPIAYDFITYAQRRYERLIGTMDCILELIQTTSVETMKINKIQENVEQKIENI